MSDVKVKECDIPSCRKRNEVGPVEVTIWTKDDMSGPDGQTEILEADLCPQHYLMLRKRIVAIMGVAKE